MRKVLGSATVLVLVLVCLVTVTGQAAVLMRVLDARHGGPNLLHAEAWQPYEQGFTGASNTFVCANGPDMRARRGVTQTVVLNQTVPQPITAVAWSKAENVGDTRNSDYALYLDLLYTDGTPLWGQRASFSVGTHDWERQEVVVLPAKPVKSVSFYLLLRQHTGQAAFRDPQLYQLDVPPGGGLFDGVPVAAQTKRTEGFFARDVAAGSDFATCDSLGLRLETKRHGALVDATVTDTTGTDRAITLIYARPAEGRWLADPRTVAETAPPQEYRNVTTYPAVGNGGLSRYPFAAVARGRSGQALGLDLGQPAFFRAGYATVVGVLYVACDLALTREKPAAQIRLCEFAFDAAWGFRGALARYYELFSDYFRCRTPEQGLWMPFYAISKVAGWEDFSFKFKEGNDETAWDDAHGILTFRYTEPMTWWMPMDKGEPRTLDAALAHARKLADKGDKHAQALFTSGHHDEQGRFVARLLDTPWCSGAVWSMNSIPGIRGAVTDFNLKWNTNLVTKLYGPQRAGNLAGEYVDSSEGYVTDVLDFRRDHFDAATTPLTFAHGSLRPAVFRGMIAYEYVHAQAGEVHALGKLMMANGTPHGLCWLAPWLDVLGTETDWNQGGKWQPMSDTELLYRRALCGPKPYCFLMNTVFSRFGPDLVEKYMKRSLAYGMFPGFFSADASTGHYFSRHDLYDRDRPLFKKYVPLCRRVAEAGWQPVTLARSSDPHVYVERFGKRYLTLFNDSPERRTATITLDGLHASAARELLANNTIPFTKDAATMMLADEDVAVLDLQPERR